LNHRPIDALVADAAIFGTRISVAMVAILWSFDAACLSLKGLKKLLPRTTPCVAPHETHGYG
jgi:hypothetical protein